MHEQFRAENLNRHGRNDLAMICQYGRESVADFFCRFWEICLKINDLSEAEKLDCFLRALVPNVVVQVELKRPMNFQEAAMYVKRANAILSRVSIQDSSKQWHKQNMNASRSFQLSFQVKSIGGSRSGLQPMEI